MDNFDKSIGNRIRGLRNEYGLTQESFAGELGISRTSLSQMENGERATKAEELKRVADYFDVSSDFVLGREELPEVILGKKKEAKKVNRLRINVPQKNVAKFKEVLLYVLGRVSGRPNVGETVLYKLLYFIDFDCSSYFS